MRGAPATSLGGPATSLLPAILPGMLPGVLATAAMTASTWIEERVRRTSGDPVDYDASDHVVTAVETVLRRPADGKAEQRLYFGLAHWGYGSSVAMAYPPLRRWTGSDLVAGLVFFGGCQAMAMTLLPLVGGTPPPQRWPRDIMVTSLAHHAIYTAVVVTTHGIRQRDRPAS